MQFEEFKTGMDIRHLYVCQMNNIYGRMVGADKLRGIAAAVVAEYSYGGYPAKHAAQALEMSLRIEAAKNIRELLYFFGIKATIVIIDSRPKGDDQQGGEEITIESIDISTDKSFLISLCEIGVISLFQKKGGRYYSVNDETFSATASDIKAIILHNQKFQKLLLKYGDVVKGFYRFGDI